MPSAIRRRRISSCSDPHLFRLATDLFLRSPSGLARRFDQFEACSSFSNSLIIFALDLAVDHGIGLLESEAVLSDYTVQNAPIILWNCCFFKIRNTHQHTPAKRGAAIMTRRNGDCTRSAPAAPCVSERFFMRWRVGRQLFVDHSLRSRAWRQINNGSDGNPPKPFAQHSGSSHSERHPLLSRIAEGIVVRRERYPSFGFERNLTV